MKWEYQFIDIDENLFKPIMDRQGEAGWELVSACHWKTLQGDWQVKLTMKRQVPQERWQATVDPAKTGQPSPIPGSVSYTIGMPCEVFKPVEAVRVVHDYDPFEGR